MVAGCHLEAFRSATCFAVWLDQIYLVAPVPWACFLLLFCVVLDQGVVGVRLV